MRLLPRESLERRLVFLDERIRPSHELAVHGDRRLDREAFMSRIDGNGDRIPDLETELLERFLGDRDRGRRTHFENLLNHMISILY